MASLAKLTRTEKGITAHTLLNELITTLPHTHPAAKLFPSTTDTIYCRVGYSKKDGISVLSCVNKNVWAQELKKLERNKDAKTS